MTNSAGKTSYIAAIAAIAILLLCLSASVLAVTPVRDVAYALAYDDIVYISTDGGGYKYFNYGQEATASTAATLNEAFEDIKANSSNTVYVVFNNVKTSENLILDGGKNYYLSGSLVSESTLYSRAVFTASGSGTRVAVGGLILSSKITAIKVGSGVVFEMSSGNITVTGGATSNFIYALDIAGKADIRGGSIGYSGTASVGAGIFVAGSGASLTLTPDTPLSVSGDCACDFNSGTIVINGGTYSATESGNSSYADSAVRLSSSATLTVNDGSFFSQSGDKTIYIGGIGSKLYFNGGVVNGKLRMEAFSDGNSPSLIVNGKTIKTSLGAALVAEGSSAQLTPTDVRFRVETANGYHTPTWANGVPADSAVGPDDLDDETIISVRDDHIITFTIGSVTKEVTLHYRETINISDYIASPAEPLYISEYAVGSDQSIDIDNPLYTVVGADTITAVLKLRAPQLTPINGVDRLYTGEATSFIAETVPYPVQVNISYAWSKNGVPVGAGRSLEVRNVGDSGDYTLSVTASYQGYSALSSVDFTVNIGKATPAYDSDYSVLGSYREGLTLGDIILKAGYTWVTPSTKIAVCNGVAYPAVYDKGDDNYHKVNLDIKVTVTKATPSAAGLPQFSYSAVYSPTTTLDDVKEEVFGSYASQFSWVDGAKVPQCKDESNLAIYNPSPANYTDDCIIVVEFSVSKAMASLGAPLVVIDVPYSRTLTAANAYRSFPEKYRDLRLTGPTLAFAPEITGLGIYGENGGTQFPTTYNPDPENYVTNTEIKAILNIVKGKSSLPSPIPSFDIVYNADRTVGTYGLSATGASATFVWADDVKDIIPAVGSHTYEALYCEDVNYFEPVSVDIPFTVNKIIPDDYEHNYVVSVAYFDGLTLGDIRLATGYTWAEPEFVITGLGSDMEFDVVYTPQDTEHYATVNIVIKVTVTKGVLYLSDFKFEDKEVTYDGAEHVLTYSGTLPAGVTLDRYENNGKVTAGEYTVTCYLKQADSERYNEIQSVWTAKLKINKAAPTFIGDAAVTLIADGSAQSVSVSLANDEQILTADRDNSFTTAGSYTITFIAEESDNYLRGEFIVSVIVKSTVLMGSADGISVQLVDAENGFSASDTISISVKNRTDKSVTLSVTANVSCPVDIIITLPDAQTPTAVKDAAGNAIEYVTADGESGKIRLVLDTLCDITIEFVSAEAAPAGLAPYAIALICIGGAIALALVAFAAVVFACVVVKRKRGYNPLKPLDRIVSVFDKSAVQGGEPISATASEGEDILTDEPQDISSDIEAEATEADNTAGAEAAPDSEPAATENDDGTSGEE